MRETAVRMLERFKLPGIGDITLQTYYPYLINFKQYFGWPYPVLYIQLSVRLSSVCCIQYQNLNAASYLQAVWQCC